MGLIIIKPRYALGKWLQTDTVRALNTSNISYQLRPHWLSSLYQADGEVYLLFGWCGWCDVAVRVSHWLSSLVLRLNTRCQLIEDNEAALAGMVLSMRSRLSSLLAPPAAN